MKPSFAAAFRSSAAAPSQLPLCKIVGLVLLEPMQPG